MAKHPDEIPPAVLARPGPFRVRFAVPVQAAMHRMAKNRQNTPYLLACIDVVEQFAANGTWPNKVGISRMVRKWQGFYRFTVMGDWRVVFAVHAHARVVQVVRLGPRREGGKSLYAE